jgi:hypothetical protein
MRSYSVHISGNKKRMPNHPENCERIAHQKEFQHGTRRRRKWPHPATQKRSQWLCGYPRSRPRNSSGTQPRSKEYGTGRTGFEDETKLQESNQGDVHLLLFELQRLLQYWHPRLSEADRVNQDFFHYKNTHDLIYTGINVQMVKAFFANKKQKANGKTSSHIQIWEYHDAILWGSQQAKQLLPRAYYDEIEKSL